MPVNFEQLRPQIKTLCSQILVQQDERRAALKLISRSFSQAADRTDLLEALLSRLRTVEVSGCALPRSERIDTHLPAPQLPEQIISLLAADGSQINPNRHDEISFGLVNSAVFWMRPGSGEIPKIMTETRMMDSPDDQLQELMTDEEQVALIRDVAERRFLADIAGEAAQSSAGDPVLALTDGPLQLYYSQKSHEKAKPLISAYYKVLQDMAADQIITAGYTDRSRSKFVVEMLALLNDARGTDEKKSLGVTDSSFFSQFLQPGERSAVFKLISPSVIQMPEETQISFFYLNCGKAGEPQISRVEIPEWVAENPKAIDLLHAHLFAQTRILPGVPYPFALHRAHEEAMVRLKEKDQIKALIVHQLAASGAPIPDKSAKQRTKDLSGIY